METFIQQVIMNSSAIPIEEKRKRYTQEEIDFYKPDFPSWSEDDIVNMLFSADMIAEMQTIEDKLQL